MQTNNNRGINSFTEEDCWRLFRFRKADLPRLFAELGIPPFLRINGAKNGSVNGEYAALYLIHRLRCYINTICCYAMRRLVIMYT